MKADYKVTRVVDLKENYRSTKNIVHGAAYVVETGNHWKEGRGNVMSNGTNGRFLRSKAKA